FIEKAKRGECALDRLGSFHVFPLNRDGIGGECKPDGRNRSRRAASCAVRNKTVLEVDLIREVPERVFFDSREFFVCQRWLQYFHCVVLNSIVIAATACAGKRTFREI